MPKRGPGRGFHPWTLAYWALGNLGDLIVFHDAVRPKWTNILRRQESREGTILEENQLRKAR